MRKAKKILPILIILVLLSGCASLKAAWDKATPQERTNIVLYGLQQSLNSGLDAGIAYVKQKNDPKITNEWHTRIIPAFDIANKTLRQLIIDTQAGKITVADALKSVSVQFNEIQSMLAAWGIKFTF